MRGYSSTPRFSDKKVIFTIVLFESERYNRNILDLFFRAQASPN